MFITGANYGRLVKLLALHDGKPTVVLARLPDADTATFRLRHYALIHSGTRTTPRSSSAASR
jgi:hypothetical protein